jgi:hypothetical protein
MNITIYVRPKNFFLLFTVDSSQSKGTHAMNIKKVSDDTGQAAQSNDPPPIAMKRLVNRFIFWFMGYGS